MASPNPFARFAQCVCDGARLMVGVPNYETYVEHMARTHPNQAPTNSALAAR